MTQNGLVWNVQRFCLHDGEGIRTTIFLMGCPLRCLWCANPEGLFHHPVLKYNADLCIGCGQCVVACPNDANSIDKNRSIIDRSRCQVSGECALICPTGARSVTGYMITSDEILSIARRDLPFFRRSGGGITCSGGEALLQADFVRDVFAMCQAEYINTAIETCGAVAWNEIEKVTPYTNTIFYDLKHMNPEKHKKLTGVDNKIILENAKKLSQLDSRVIFRMPVIPKMNDDVENIANTAEFLKSIGAFDLELLPYHMYGVSKYKMYGIPYSVNAKPPDDQYMKKIKDEFMRFNCDLKIRIM